MYRTMMIVLAVLFAGFLITIITLANLGRGEALFSLVQHLPGGDVTGHLILLGTMSLFLNAALRFATFPLGSWQILRGTAILLVVMTLEETSQLFFVSRSFSLYDLLGNVFGIIIFGEIGRWLYRWKR